MLYVFMKSSVPDSGSQQKFWSHEAVKFLTGPQILWMHFILTVGFAVDDFGLKTLSSVFEIDRKTQYVHMTYSLR